MVTRCSRAGLPCWPGGHPHCVRPGEEALDIGGLRGQGGRFGAVSGPNGASATLPPVTVQVPTARPWTSANGRNSPLMVISRPCGPRPGRGSPSQAAGGRRRRAGAAVAAGTRPAARPGRRDRRRGRRAARRSRPGPTGRRAAAARPTWPGRGRWRGRGRPGSGGRAGQRPVPVERRVLRGRGTEPVTDQRESVVRPAIGPRTISPRRVASASRWTMAWPSVRTPAAAIRSASWARVSGPSAVSARSMTATARSASAGGTPSCASLRALPRSSGGVVSGCSHQ